MAERVAQQPGEDVIERQRRFHQKEARLQELRQSRLSTTAKPPEMHMYNVVRHNGAWRVLHLGRYSTGFGDQQAAIAAAVERPRRRWRGAVARGSASTAPTARCGWPISRPAPFPRLQIDQAPARRSTRRTCGNAVSGPH